MVQDPMSGTLRPFDFEHILKQVPELKSFAYNLDTITFEPIVDSSNIEPETWVQLAEIIQRNYDKYDGFVILHGTDTMAYSASALSFLLENLTKPVIFTGSQLPIGMIRTDGKENLITAIEIAASQKNDQAMVPEVCIYFENHLFRGNRTTKFNAEHFDAFLSPNYLPLATSGINIRYNYSSIHYPVGNAGHLKTYSRLENKVAVLPLFPGISREYVESITSVRGLKGLILQSFGAGNAPTNDWFTRAIRTALEKEIVVLNTTQCIAGSVDMGRYETSEALLNAGVLSGYDSTFEAAITKMMFVLANFPDQEEIKNQFSNPISGEITPLSV